MNTTENNKIIAEFMGYEILDEYCDPYPKNLEVNSLPMLEFMFNSWDELMEVVEKIESLGYWTEILSGVHHECRIGRFNNSDEFILKDSGDKKEAVYNACLEFIKWYNEQNK